VKILQILDKSPDQGGLAVHVSELCEQLKQHGHASPVLRLVDQTISGHNNTALWQDEYTLPCSYGLLQGYRLRTALDKLLAEIKPDIVHVHGCFTTLSPVLLSAIRKKTRLVGTLHDVRPFCYVMSRRYLPTGKLCDRRCGAGCFTSGCMQLHGPVDVIRFARRWQVDARTLGQWQLFDRVIAPSEYIRDLAVQHGIASQHLRLVPHGIKLPPPVADTRKPHDTPTIMYLGSLFEYKGVLQLVEALHQLQHTDWRAILVGDGPLREQIGQQLNQFGLADRVEILDHVRQREEIYQLLANARMLVLPSIIPEAFALVGVEALAAGTPVVSFALGGIRQWFRDGENGLAAADMDCKDLARQIDTLLQSPQLADDMGNRGRVLVEKNFTSSRAFAHTLSIYQELSASPR
jgi:glycosyltransferase involved in cell wall biosynthesis